MFFTNELLITLLLKVFFKIYYFYRIAKLGRAISVRC